MAYECLQEMLRSFDPNVVAGGRDYASRGLVTQLRHEGDAVRAIVQGTQRYEVLLGALASAEPFAGCTCVAYSREAQCKHVAALAWTLSDPRKLVRAEAPPVSAVKAPVVARDVPREPDVLPAIFRSAYSASRFLSRLSLYAGVPLGNDTDDRYSTLPDWWWRSIHKPTRTSAELCKHVLAHEGEIAKVLTTLRTWRPPPPPLPGTAYAALYGKLTVIYESAHAHPRIRNALPGPLDARHPGFTLSFDTKGRTLVATERFPNTPPGLLTALRLGIRVPLEPGADVRFENNTFTDHSETDAWELFALREILIALEAMTDTAVQLIVSELGRPVWDHVLEQLASRPARAAEPREWTFCLVEAYRGLEHKLFAFSRPARTGDQRIVKWKKQSLEALLAVEFPSESKTLEVGLAGLRRLERDIARLALCSVSSTYGRTDVTMTVGTPHGHELARLLAQHPRCLVGRDRTANPETDLPAEIIAGLLTMDLQPGPGGVLRPRFFVGEKELPIPIASLIGTPTSVFRGAVRANEDRTTLVSVQVPPALRPWLDMAARMGDALAFPPEAVSRLASATQTLVSSGVARLPKEALGEELPYAPSAAIRIEWCPSREGSDAAAVIEVLIAVRPGAPLVEPGEGPRLFTFEEDGRRVFVERDLAREVPLVLDTIDRIEAPVSWHDEVGRTEGIEETLALGEYLDRNPLGLPIEVKVGRAPTVTQWTKQRSRLDVRKVGTWLVLDGSLELDGVKLTIGDVLEAARHARRYVRAADGIFLELSKEAIAQLQPVAMAAELAPSMRGPRDGEQDGVGTSRIHDGFGSLLAEASALFGDVRAPGLDLAEYARRFEERARDVSVPSLERGELRPYQKDGVEWMLRLATWAPGCVLADDMGLGKTIQTAAVLKARAKLGPALIIAPASVSSNWVTELERFMPSLKVRWYNSERDTVLADLEAGDVLIVSYGLLQRSAVFGERQWSTVVVDEAQYIKNVGAQRTDAVRSLQKDFTITLTGTPLENHLGELFSIVDIAFPGLLGEDATFRQRFRRPIEVERDGDRLAALGRLLAPFLLRRTRTAVLHELPPREEITEHLELSPEERKRYLALREVCEQQFTKRKQEETPAQLRIALLAALTRLRQLACDVRLLDPTFEGGSTKIARAVELAQQLASEGNRALVFSTFTTFLDKVRVALEAAGLRVAYLTGETPTTKRRPIIDAFQAGEYDIFCVSLLAGGTGLNLTKASYVIHLDPWWNPAAEEQATSRAHRMGQTEPVTVYRLVARGTIEEAVLALHADKRELAAAVLDGKANAKAITSTELLDLLRFGA